MENILTLETGNGGEEGFLSTFFGNLDVAVIVLLVSFVIGKLVSILLNKLFLEIQLDKNLHFLISKNLKISKLISNFARILIYALGILYSLNLLGILQYIVNVLGVIVLIAVFGSLILSVRDFLPNLVSGFWTRKKLKEGDSVLIGDIQGEVESFDMLSLTLKSDEDTLIIPYSVFQNKRLKKK